MCKIFRDIVFIEEIMEKLIELIKRDSLSEK